MSFLDDLPDEPVALVPTQRRHLTKEQQQAERLKEAEDRILIKALATVEDIGGARDIDDDHDDEVPADWIAEVGMAEAAKRLRVAKDARRNKKDAPVYLEHQRAVALGIVKARAANSLTVNALSATFIMPGATPIGQSEVERYPILDVEAEEVDDTEK